MTDKQPAGFWKIFGASALSISLIAILGMLLFFGILSYMFKGIGDEIKSVFDFEQTIEVKDNSILEIKLSQSITDRSFNKLNTSSFSLDKNIGLLDVFTAIKDAKKDDHIKGIYLNASGSNINLANAEELRIALLDFKKSGKFIYAYSDGYTQRAYHICSVADKVYLYPSGRLEFKGLSSTINFYKDFLAKLNLEVQVIRGSNNQFKSAVEPFLRNDISEPNKRQTQRFLDGLWSTMLVDISETRDIDTASLQLIADSLLIRNGADAVKHGLVDELLYADEFENALLIAAKTEDGHKVKTISISQYINRSDNYVARKKQQILPNIAVIYASGSIHGGTSDEESIGDETMVKAIRRASEDPFVEAIVLRVNSPGGDALASDLMWDALNKAKENKPVVVSMGGVAASGGYYIACMADKVFADPTTITGSIGVFMVVPNTKAFFENDLGIHFSRVKTAEHADMSYLQMSFNSFTRPLTSDEKKILQNGVDETYKEFLDRVVSGRENFTSRAEVDSIGQGRVWCGTDALEIGLVDTLGGLQDAIKYAAKLAKVQNPKILELPRFDSKGLEKIISMLNDNQAFLKTSSIENELAPILKEKLDAIKSLTDVGRMQARMFWDISVD